MIDDCNNLSQKKCNNISYCKWNEAWGISNDQCELSFNAKSWIFGAIISSIVVLVKELILMMNLIPIAIIYCKNYDCSNLIALIWCRILFVGFDVLLAVSLMIENITVVHEVNLAFPYFVCLVLSTGRAIMFVKSK